MLLGFELSGEHNTIPVSEVIACLDILNVNFKTQHSLNGCLVVDVNCSDIDNIISQLSKRLAMTHHIIKVFGIGKGNEDSILEIVENSNIEFKGTYRIRARRIRGYLGIDTEKIERKIGEIFLKKNFRADLKTPNNELRVLFTDGMCIFGIIAGCVNRKIFESRKPHFKPFFYPGVMMPAFSLALVNIAKPDKILFDPFCGTGGILIEGGIKEIEVIGSDVQRKILLGAKMNLEHYNINYSLLFQDACKLSFKDESIDAVVTDPPYGRSAAIKADSLSELQKGSLSEIYRVLKKGKRAVFISDHSVDEFAKISGFEIVESHVQRVHKSLTRYILVMEK